MKKYRLHLLVLALFWLVGFYISEPAETLEVAEAAPVLRKEASLMPLALPGPRQCDTNPEPVVTLSADEAHRKAEAYFQANKEKWELQTYHAYSTQESRTPLFTEYIYNFSQGALPIVGMRIRLKVDYKGNLEEIENTYRPIPEVDIDGERRLTVPEAVEMSPHRYEAKAQVTASSIIFVREGSSEGEIAYTLPVTDRLMEARTGQLVLRASDGQVLSRSFAHSEAH